MIGAGKVVCVTGASGYIASWLVKLLLERGYTVKASVRDLNDPTKTMHLTSLDGAKERLLLLKANLLEEGSFDEIVNGCEGVFHTASPCQFSVPARDPQAELLDPAVKGTLNVLRSCARVPSVKRVVLTSSMAAVINNTDLKDDVVVDESWFSDPSYCEKNELWYMLSKTLAENAAWKFAKEHGIDMVAINPALVIGPLLQPTINQSVELILNLVTGAQSFPNATLPWVDVRDVACAHILAFEIPSANGRYCLVERFANGSQLLEVLQELYPTLEFPAKFIDCSSLTFPDYKISQEKVRSLGIHYIPLEMSLKDTMKSFEEKNLVSL
ncbi:cinnamoyl-CoA reductase 1-like isoform X1 [Coffea eugenioides]|uniref:Dihydroflavonol 4-reductase n=1 Tax=Coffea arabica TaxID=13443 RepID=A0A6P6WFC3_COFAR|nr:cinnamoyl-CoA reductase 1-like [Coffea arabica]XP_027159584.1 cinnamoyl-CoA reductase 1-like isoform X1 [Coffea eugenioides]